MINKVYVESEHDDREVEETVSKMDNYKLKIVVFGIARGWGFDQSVAIALSSDESSVWLVEI